jgi:hypothetical protein
VVDSIFVPSLLRRLCSGTMLAWSATIGLFAGKNGMGQKKVLSAGFSRLGRRDQPAVSSHAVV